MLQILNIAVHQKQHPHSFIHISILPYPIPPPCLFIHYHQLLISQPIIFIPTVSDDTSTNFLSILPQRSDPIIHKSDLLSFLLLLTSCTCLDLATDDYVACIVPFVGVFFDRGECPYLLFPKGNEKGKEERGKDWMGVRGGMPREVKGGEEERGGEGETETEAECHT